MMIPREIVEEIIYRTDITDFIGSYVTLKRAGSNMSGLCPFHSERSPSFTVFPNTKSFYCFGCGAGGDAITFAMRAENLDYPSALEFLANRVGITIPQNQSEYPDTGVSRKRIFDMNLEAARFFRSCLFDEKLGKVGMDYLRLERKLDLATIKHFGLGFSPNNFGVLTNHMKGLGFTDEELITGFLCGKSQKSGKAFDYFRNRVIFPIIDPAGNIIAFGGRVMDDSKPKYLNSSDTPGFKKSKNLFALNFAKNHCSESIILCEGYMDVIALHAAGFENAVATLGTALTPDQARMLTKYTKKVILSYDADEAGQRATDRAMKILSEVGLDVRVLHINGAKDPDEYIKKFGADRFRAVIGESRTGFDFKLNRILSQYDITIPDDKIKASNDICRIISESYSPVEREVYISRAAQILSLPADVIRNNVDIITRKRMYERKNDESKNAHLSIKNIGDRINPDSAKYVQANALEENILGMMLAYPEHRAAVFGGRIGLEVDDFITEFGKRVFSAVKYLSEGENEFLPALLGERFSPEEMGRIEKMKQNRMSLEKNTDEIFEASVKALKEVRCSEEAKSSGDKFSILRQKQEKLKKIKDSNNTNKN